MRKIISVLMILILACCSFVACSKKDKEKEEEDFASTITTNDLLYQQFRMWDAYRTNYLLEENAIFESTSYKGTTAEGKDYESAFSIAGNTYRTAEVIFKTTEEHFTVIEYFDVDTNLIFVAVTTVDVDSNGLVNYDIAKYLVDNGDTIVKVNHMINTDASEATFEDVSKDNVAFDCFTFQEAIDKYAK